MEASVDIREEFTVLTPGGGEMTFATVAGEKLIPITDPNRHGSWIATFKTEGAAALHAQALNADLRRIGIEDGSYLVAKRTITTVTSAWDDSV